MLTEEMPSSLFNKLLEGGDSLAEASLAYEISMLRFIPPGEIGQL